MSLVKADDDEQLVIWMLKADKQVAKTVGSANAAAAE